MTRSDAPAGGSISGVAPSAPAARGRSAFGHRFVAPLLLGGVLNPVNSSVIATALVAIAAAMDVPVSHTALLISSLYLTSAIAQPTAGRLAEELGPRRVFLAGVATVLAGGVLGTWATAFSALVVARVLIGAGTSAAYPSAMLLVRRRAQDSGQLAESTRVLGYLAIIGSATIAVGPTFGGVLVGWLGWRAAFVVNIPFALLTLVLVVWWLPADDRLRIGSARALASRIDVAGVVAFGAMLTALLVALMSLEHPNWGVIAFFVLSAAFLVVWELRASNPFFDVRLLAHHGALTRTYVRHGLSLVGVYTTMYGLTQWMQVANGMDSSHAGLALLPMGVCSVSAAWVASRSRHLRAVLTLSALSFLSASTATLLLSGDSPLAAVMAVTAMFGLASGSANVTNQTVLYHAAAPESIGTASGLLRTFGYVGSIASATITGLAYHDGVDDQALHRIGAALVVIATAVLLMSLLDRGIGGPGAATRGARATAT